MSRYFKRFVDWHTAYDLFILYKISARQKR
jgi:hypothetical protein